ncbi:hypothetical protein [Paenibacillus alvei]|uniref:Uncharacterized protein n=1 Tax=Paenibacillus alvei TaxID=44250 RepID=A0AAP7A1Y5_PAEAL|nr:hypothetical protein [Paenibacillus alvei]NOJ74193.1 hypothetical protein [Paenibacillus alvei]
MEISAIVAIIAAISGIALGWMGRTRTIKQDIAQEASADAVQEQMLSISKRGVDDIRADVRAQGQRVDGLYERVTRIEESAKQAHKRIDRLEEKT